MTQALLIDHDGVLSDSEIPYFEATREVFAKAGAELTPAIWARWYLAESRGSRAVALGLGIRESDLEALLAERDALFHAKLATGVPYCRGVLETLDPLAASHRLCLVSGSPLGRLRSIHGPSNFLDRFECAVTADQCERTKPDPEPYLRALERMGLAARDCVAVEDSPRGLASAHAAGIRCIVIPTGLTDLECCGDAWKILADFSELPSALEGQ